MGTVGVKNFQQVIISAVINLIVTFTTIAGFGWNIHKEIMKEVTEIQERSSVQLEARLNTMINSKLEKEPAAYRIETQSEQIKTLTEELQKTQAKLATVDSNIEELKRIILRGQR